MAAAQYLLPPLAYQKADRPGYSQVGHRQNESNQDSGDEYGSDDFHRVM
jgi:hypothetical protein